MTTRHDAMCSRCGHGPVTVSDIDGLCGDCIRHGIEIAEATDLDECWFCDQPWGSCSCGWPSPEAVFEGEVPGFEHEGVWITRPNVSICGRFYVDPTVYYGAPYLAFAIEYGHRTERRK